MDVSEEHVASIFRVEVYATQDTRVMQVARGARRYIPEATIAAVRACNPTTYFNCINILVSICNTCRDPLMTTYIQQICMTFLYSVGHAF
jgi:hypothetical protein